MNQSRLRKIKVKNKSLENIKIESFVTNHNGKFNGGGDTRFRPPVVIVTENYAFVCAYAVTQVACNQG